MSFHPAVFVCVLLLFGGKKGVFGWVFLRGWRFGLQKKQQCRSDVHWDHKAAKGLSTCGELFLLLCSF